MTMSYEAFDRGTSNSSGFASAEAAGVEGRPHSIRGSSSMAYVWSVGYDHGLNLFAEFRGR